MVMDGAEMIKRDITKCDKYIMERIREELMEEFVTELKEMIMVEYDAELTGRVADRKSRTNPMFYREEFAEGLDEYEWLEEGTTYTILHVPDIATFNWRYGRLRVIENIVDGTAGTFVEVDEQQYIQMYGKLPRQSIAIYDKTVPRRQRIYLLRYSPSIQQREIATFGRQQLVSYPFSNTPPIDIFSPAINHANKAGPIFIRKITTMATKEYYK